MKSLQKSTLKASIAAESVCRAAQAETPMLASKQTPEPASKQINELATKQTSELASKQKSKLASKQTDMVVVAAVAVVTISATAPAVAKTPLPAKQLQNFLQPRKASSSYLRSMQITDSGKLLRMALQRTEHSFNRH